eukprot:361808-Chlamydomonas_euryale.AAC.27
MQACRHAGMQALASRLCRAWITTRGVIAFHSCHHTEQTRFKPVVTACPVLRRFRQPVILQSALTWPGCPAGVHVLGSHAHGADAHGAYAHGAHQRYTSYTLSFNLRHTAAAAAAAADVTTNALSAAPTHAPVAVS